MGKSFESKLFHSITMNIVKCSSVTSSSSASAFYSTSTIRSLIKSVKDAFLPAGYPDSVSAGKFSLLSPTCEITMVKRLLGLSDVGLGPGPLLYN